MRNVVFLFGILNSAFSQNYSCNGPLIPDLSRRARNYTATGSNEDPYISDENLGPGWFSANNYRMSDSSNIPNITQCGTEIPIYLKEVNICNGNYTMTSRKRSFSTQLKVESKGKHPNQVQMPNGVQLNVTTCEKFPWDDCANERTIYVILCNRLFHYFLQQTSANAGYCFDPYDPPDDLQNISVPPTTLNESSSGVLAEEKTPSAVIVAAVVGAVAGFAILVIAVMIVTRTLMQRRPITCTHSHTEENRTDNNHNNTPERSTTNDDSNYYERGVSIPEETHVYDRIYVSTTNSVHLASDEIR